MKQNIVVVLFIIFTLLLPYKSHAKERKDNKGVISFMLENDIFANEDKHYTNGVRLAYLSPETSVSKHIASLANKMLFFQPLASKRYSYSMGQSMFTPRNITKSNPNLNDRPYAGWTYLSMGIISSDGKRYDNFNVSLGVVGKYSFAEKTQKLVHKIVGSPKPMGWGYQLHNEPGILLSYDRQWRNRYGVSAKGFQSDLTPSLGVNLGNIYTCLSAGIMSRFGMDLPDDYGPPRIRPSLPGSDFFVPTKSFGWYLFAGAEGRAVARNIFLDGNTFRSSRHVDKKNFVLDLQLGGTLTFKDLRVGYTHVIRTKEFKTQKAIDQFGAISLSFRL